MAQSKKDKETIAKVRKAFDSARYDEHRQYKDFVWNACYKSWRSILEKKVPRRSNLFIPVTHQTIETMVAKTLGAIFDSSTLFEFGPIDPKDFANAEAVTKFSNFDIQRIPNVYHKINTFLRHLYIYGTAIMRTYWDFDSYEDPKMKGDIKIRRDQYNFKIIPVRHIYIDPFAKILDDANWIIQRTVMNMSEFEQMMDKKEFKKLTQEQLKSIETTPDQALTFDHDTRRFNEQDRFSSLAFDDKRKFVEILEYFDKTEDRWIMIASDKLVLRDIPNPLKNHGTFPFVTCVDIPDPEHFYGVSTAETIYDLQAELNAFRNHRMDKKNFTMNPMWKVKHGSMFDRKDITPRLGGVVKVKNMDDLEPLQMGDTQNSDYVEEQAIKTDIQTTSSISDFSLGQGSSGFNDTATGVSIINSNADSRIVAKVKYIENEVLIPLGYNWLHYQAQFMNDQEVIKLNGVAVSIDRAMLNRPYNLKVKASTQLINKQVRQNNLMQLSQVALNNPNVNMQEFLKMLFDEFGVNPEKIVVQAPPLPPPDAGGNVQAGGGANPNASLATQGELGNPAGRDFISGQNV